MIRLEPEILHVNGTMKVRVITRDEHDEIIDAEVLTLEAGENRRWSLPPRPSRLPRWASATTRGSSEPRPVRRPVTDRTIFIPGPAKSWACIFEGPREK